MGTIRYGYRIIWGTFRYPYRIATVTRYGYHICKAQEVRIRDILLTSDIKSGSHKMLSKEWPNFSLQVFTSIHYNVFLRKRALQFKSEDVTDIDNSPQKFYFPLATCTIHSLPILLNLEESQYTDNEAFRLLTHNIQLPEANKR